MTVRPRVQLREPRTLFGVVPKKADGCCRARSVRELMEKSELKKIGEGFYVDGKGSVYFDMNEFIAFHKLPNEAQTKTAVWEEIKRAFAPDAIKRLDD